MEENQQQNGNSLSTSSSSSNIISSSSSSSSLTSSSFYLPILDNSESMAVDENEEDLTNLAYDPIEISTDLYKTSTTRTTTINYNR